MNKQFKTSGYRKKWTHTHSHIHSVRIHFDIIKSKIIGSMPLHLWTWQSNQNHNGAFNAFTTTATTCQRYCYFTFHEFNCKSVRRNRTKQHEIIPFTVEDTHELCVWHVTINQMFSNQQFLQICIIYDNDSGNFTNIWLQNSVFFFSVKISAAHTHNAMGRRKKLDRVQSNSRCYLFL